MCKVRKMGNSTSFWMQHKNEIVSIIGILFLIIFVALTYTKWNQIWYDFGKNLYHLFH